MASISEQAQRIIDARKYPPWLNQFLTRAVNNEKFTIMATKKLRELRGGADRLSDEEFLKLGEIVDYSMVPSTEKYLDRSKVKRSKKEEEERNAAISILASIYNEIIKFLLSAVPLSSLPFIQNQAASTSQSVAGDTYDAFTRAAAYTGYKGYKAGSVATPFSSALKEEKN